MNFTEKQEKGQEFLQQIITKAWEDKAFKQELINAPAESIEKLTGGKFNLPEGKTLIVNDQTDENTVYLNIPRKIKLEDMELSEEQLEAVAGGDGLLYDMGYQNGQIIAGTAILLYHAIFD